MNVPSKAADLLKNTRENGEGDCYDWNSAGSRRHIRGGDGSLQTEFTELLQTADALELLANRDSVRQLAWKHQFSDPFACRN